MRQIVVMPGGFHPFHAGHASLYQSAIKAFPDADVYVAATNDTKTRPFPFSIKEKLAKLAGVADKHFVQVKSPFKAEEITSHYNPNEDVLIFVRSEKDKNEQPKPGGTKKDGSPAYFQPWPPKRLQPFSKHAYITYLPTVEFGPGITSASEIRDAWPTLNDKRKTAMVMSLYPVTQKNPKLAANVVKMLDMGMGNELAENIKVDPVVKSVPIQKTVTQPKQHVYIPPEKKTPAVINHIKPREVKEGASLSVEQLAHISDKALDDAYHYGRSTPGANFGWMANMQSAKAAKRLIDAGVTDIEAISDAIHKGWNVTAAADYKGQLQLDTPTPDEKKLKRAKLAMQSYSQLPEDEKEKDRVVARALLQAITGSEVDESLGIPYPTTYEQENNKFKRRGPMRITDLTEFAPNGSDDREPDEEILRKLAAMWWNGTEQQMRQAQQTLHSMGWEIGQNESGDDDAGVFVIRIGDEHGDSYIAFPHSDLGLNEDYLDEK